MMKNAAIRNAVRRVFSAAGELALSAVLIRKTAGDYIPGEGATETQSSFAVRLLRNEKPLSARNNAADPLLEAGLHYGLLESPDLVPRIDDDLMLASISHTLVQVVPADLGAGILYEVMYR
jgi:hypothetical protein